MSKQATEKIPNSWKETTLGEMAEINPREPLSKGTVAKYMPMENLSPFTRKIYSFETRKFNGGSKFRNGDTLLARITPCLENGKTAYVNILESNEIGFGSTEYIVLREKHGLSDSKFIYYFAISPSFRNAAIQSMTGTSGRQRVQTDLIANRRFNVPPLSEQQAIAAVLSSFDDKIELLREQNKALEATAQAIFKEWFIDFEFPVSLCHSRESGNPDWIPNQVGDDRKGYKSSGGKMIASELGELPDGWKVGSMGELINQLLPGEWGKEVKAEKFTEMVICFRGTDLPDLKNGSTSRAPFRYIRRDKLEKIRIFEGDLIIEISGGTIGQSTGRVAYINKKILDRINLPAVSSNFCKVLRPKDKKFTYFIFAFCEYLYNKGLFFNFENGTTGIQNLNLKGFLEFEVVMPEDQVIFIFSNILEEIFNKVQFNNSQIQTLSKIRDTLLPKLMTGQLRVKG